MFYFSSIRKEWRSYIAKALPDQNACVFFTIIVIVMFLGFTLANPAPDFSGISSYSSDLLWTIGNNQALERSFPPITTRVFGLPFKYHYFVSIYHAMHTYVTGINHVEYFFHFSQIFELLFLTTSLYALGLTVLKSRKAAFFFMWILFFTNCASLSRGLNMGYGIYLNVFLAHLVNVPFGFELSLSFLSLFAAVKIYFFREDRVNLKLIAISIVFMIIMTGTKGVSGLIMAGVLTVIIPIIYFSLPSRKMHSLLLFPAIISFLGTYFLLLSESSSTLYFSPGFTVHGTAVWSYYARHFVPKAYAAIILIPVHLYLFLPFSVSAMLPWFYSKLRNFLQLDFYQYLIGGIIVCGILGAYIYGHRGNSQLYFLITAIPFMHLAASEFICSKWHALHVSFKLYFITMFVVASFTTVFIFYYNIIRGVAGITNVRQYLKSEISHSPKHDAITRQEFDGLKWLELNSSPKAVVSSNRIYLGEDQIDRAARYYYYSVFSNRQMFLEGFSAAKPVKGMTKLIEMHRATNDYIFSDASEPLRLEKAINAGINYVIVSKFLTNKNVFSFKPVYSNADIEIYKVQ